MQVSQEFRLIILIAAAFLVGMLVLALNPSYRIPSNLASNERYYPETPFDLSEEVTPVPVQPEQPLGF